jgi:hypothetical protein
MVATGVLISAHPTAAYRSFRPDRVGFAVTSALASGNRTRDNYSANAAGYRMLAAGGARGESNSEKSDEESTHLSLRWRQLAP